MMNKVVLYYFHFEFGMKPIELSVLRKSVYAITEKTPSSTVSRVLEGLSSPIHDLQSRVDLAHILAERKPNASTIGCYLNLSTEAHQSNKPYALYENNKNIYNLETLREFALFANRDNDPVYLKEIIDHAKRVAIDPVIIKNNVATSFKWIIGLKSLLICGFFNLHFVPTAILLGINATLLFFVQPIQRESLEAVRKIDQKYFFTPLTSWTSQMIVHYIIALRAVESVKCERIDDIDSTKRIETLAHSKHIHHLLKAGDYNKAIKVYQTNQNTTPSAVGSIINSYFETNQPLKALKLYEDHRKEIFNTHNTKKRFVLNNLIKAVGFGGYPQYAEFILLCEFLRLDILPTDRSYIKVIQSLQHTSPEYYQFWSALSDVQSEHHKQMTDIFGISSDDVLKIVTRRADFVKQGQSYQLPDNLAVSFAYFQQLQLTDAISIGVMMTSCYYRAQYVAAIRLFGFYHQMTENQHHMSTFVDPFDQQYMLLSFEIFRQPKSLNIKDLHLFGKSSIIHRTKRYPPTKRMMNIVHSCLQHLKLDKPDLMSQLKIRQKNLASN